MIVRLIGTIIALVLIAFFVGFNLDNKCSVNLLVHEFENVPVFFTIIISFVVGVIFALPFAFIHRSSKQKNNGNANAASSVKPPKKARAPFFKKKKGFEKKNEAPLAKPVENTFSKATESSDMQSDATGVQAAQSSEKQADGSKKNASEADAKL